MAESNIVTTQWNYPTDIRVGVGQIKALPSLLVSKGLKAPLLVTDPGLAGLDFVSSCIEACVQTGLACTAFSTIKSNPTLSNITAGVEAYHSGQHDSVIALGGGSALDAGKAIALMVNQSRPLWDFEDVGDNWMRADTAGIVPVIAVPTTAGTGSEVGRAAVITDDQERRKKIIFHPRMLPGLVILDPTVTAALPPSLTAATGMDALSHNLEALCAPGYHPMADGIALQGIKLIKENLLCAFQDGTNLNARMNMLVASTMGATAFQKGLGGMHALAHSLGALYDKHHGLLNAILMPYVLQANFLQINTLLADAGKSIGLEDASYKGFLSWVLDLRQSLAIPHTLAEIGIDDRDSVLIGEMAEKDPSAAGNPVLLDAAGYAQIFQCSLEGNLE